MLITICVTTVTVKPSNNWFTLSRNGNFFTITNFVQNHTPKINIVKLIIIVIDTHIFLIKLIINDFFFLHIG